MSDRSRHQPIDRRRLLHLSALGLAAVLAGCGSPQRPGWAASTTTSLPAVPAAGPPPTGAPVADLHTQLPPIPPARPGPPVVYGLHPLPGDRRVALTIDDGYDQATAEAYVAWAAATGTPVTFSPNGAYRSIWAPLAPRLAGLIAKGQVQIANHTYNHPSLTRLPDVAVAGELQRNELWIEETFGVTSRPWYRPPYGAHDRRTDNVAGSIGFTNVLMWDGSLGDSRLLTPEVLLAQARRYLQGGYVVLGHANHPTVTTLFDQLLAIIAERGLEPVTVDELFATSRVGG